MKTRTRDVFTSAIFIAVIFFLLNGCSTTPARFETSSCGDYECVKETISRLAREEMRKNNVEGLSVALVDDHGLIWAQGFGYADKEKGLIGHGGYGLPGSVNFETLYRDSGHAACGAG